MDFYKYEATGNDFILIDGKGDAPRLSRDAVRMLCDRHKGVGADGVIVVLPSDCADLRMRVLNTDGSEAEMCGNGIRALFCFAIDRGIADGDTLDVETFAGTRTVRSRAEEGDLTFTVDMGKASCRYSDIPANGPPDQDAIGVGIDLGDNTMTCTCVSMGNPHCVVFVEDVDSYPVADIGPRVERHEMFPERTNVEFVEVVSTVDLRVRVWERGVGETMACGTGACASLVAAHLNGRSENWAVVHLLGGDLEVALLEDGVYLSGPARHVFNGTVEIKE